MGNVLEYADGAYKHNLRTHEELRARRERLKECWRDIAHQAAVLERAGVATVIAVCDEDASGLLAWYVPRSKRGLPPRAPTPPTTGGTPVAARQQKNRPQGVDAVAQAA